MMELLFDQLQYGCGTTLPEGMEFQNNALVLTFQQGGQIHDKQEHVPTGKKIVPGIAG